MSQDDPTPYPPSRAANQGKAEPMPSAPRSGAPTTGADAPQRPGEGLDRPDLASSTGRGLGPRPPAQQTSGAAQRVPGSLGRPAEGEQPETDLPASAASLSGPGPAGGPGDAQGVPVPSEQPAPGTAEELPVAQGARTPR